MARRSSSSGKSKTKTGGETALARMTAPLFRPVFFALRWLRRLLIWGFALTALAVLLYRFVDPPTTYYMFSEGRRLGSVKQEWADLQDIAPVMARSVVAAEDANFCQHWGLDLKAIRAAMAEGGRRGASTISQQTVKNTYLWHGRNWTRKTLEAGLTLLVEAAWTKRRILEVYLNVAEFDTGVFGVHAAARHYFGVTPDKLTAVQAAQLAAVLPAPKKRSASKPTTRLRRRAASIRDGAATILADGRARCFSIAKD